MKRTVGYACLAGFIACIFLANYAITHWGTVPFPGGPHTVTLLGLTAPSGVLFVGLSFTLRDGAQLALGKWWVLGAIGVGAALSYLVAPSLALGTPEAVAAIHAWKAERDRWEALARQLGAFLLEIAARHPDAVTGEHPAVDIARAALSVYRDAIKEDE